MVDCYGTEQYLHQIRVSNVRPLKKHTFEKKNAIILIIEINKEKCSLGYVKMQDILSYYSAKLENNNVLIWKYLKLVQERKFHIVI